MTASRKLRVYAPRLPSTCHPVVLSPYSPTHLAIFTELFARPAFISALLHLLREPGVQVIVHLMSTSCREIMPLRHLHHSPSGRGCRPTTPWLSSVTPLLKSSASSRPAVRPTVRPATPPPPCGSFIVMHDRLFSCKRPGVTDGGVSALLCLIDFILYRRPDTLVRHRA